MFQTDRQAALEEKQENDAENREANLRTYLEEARSEHLRLLEKWAEDRLRSITELHDAREAIRLAKRIIDGDYSSNDLAAWLVLPAVIASHPARTAP